MSDCTEPEKKDDSQGESDDCCNCFEEMTVIVDLAHELADRLKKLEAILEVHKLSKLLAQVPI
jgi:hypothetical protein